MAHSTEVMRAMPHVVARRLHILSDGRLRWGVSVTIAVLLHVAAIAALVATMHTTPPVTMAATDIEVALIDPVDKPDDPQPPNKSPEETSPAVAEPSPPPQSAAQATPIAPAPPPPADPPLAHAEPQPLKDTPPLPPAAAPAPPGSPSPTRADADSSQPKADETPPGAEFGFSIPVGPRESPPPPEPASPPGSTAARPKVPQPAAAPQATRMAPLVVVAGAQQDPRLPSYPIDAQARGEQGNVLVEVALDPGGAIRGARIKTSSGHASLDAAALRSAQSLRFRPPRPPPGVVLRHTIQVEIPFSYRLQ
ncbi:MAG TPA: TonB family protein [Vineibacter sp.]|nr:TonB family protein [Vineibacter sp.]